MSEVWITDSSPLIALSKVGHAELLLDLPGELIVPNAVLAELRRGSEDDPARGLVEAGFGKAVAPRALPSRLLSWTLGEGETEVLALGLERPGAVAVLDDAAGRRCAAAFGVPVIGTLGVVARAKRLGRIESSAAIFRALVDAGLWIDETIIRSILARLGEPW